ncbi:hypothetical protein ED208_02110 [Stagnimonas aquatica]|uniref:Uncharacterized protein n=2 Tax=Stagnimonas aquatica TaxID=2689987 RepID=A0A3N0VKP4_9GAMM|nr:hypothetical protein ED208_02110 [Stagnimonas aquatica]
MMHSSPANYCFELSLTARQIGLLEELRAGGDLHLFVSLHALTSESDVTYSCSDSLIFTVPQSNWIKQLNDSKFTDVLLVEVPIGSLTPAHLVTFLQKARNQIATADYRGAIATCRAAMELLAEGEQKEDQQAVSGFKENPRGMSSENRLRLIRHAARHYTHLANHADSESLKASYTLRDAVLLLTLATAFSAHQLDA